MSAPPATQRHSRQPGQNPRTARGKLRRPPHASLLAKHARLSPPRFARLIKRFFRLTPSQLITQTRLAAAARMLGQTRLGIAEIAIDAAFTTTAPSPAPSAPPPAKPRHSSAGVRIRSTHHATTLRTYAQYLRKDARFALVRNPRRQHPPNVKIRIVHSAKPFKFPPSQSPCPLIRPVQTLCLPVFNRGCLPPPGAVTPNPLFSSHAVLQRDAEIPVWGTADNDEKITVTFAGQSVSTTAEDGKSMFTSNRSRRTPSRKP